MTMTTIRVDRSLRDQINEIATERGTTAGAVINTLLKEHLERELMADVKRKMSSMSTQGGPTTTPKWLNGTPER